jgi:gamma-glutamyltranspeptidase/glutathione hydrolase
MSIRARDLVDRPDQCVQHFESLRPADFQTTMFAAGLVGRTCDCKPALPRSDSGVGPNALARLLPRREIVRLAWTLRRNNVRIHLKRTFMIAQCISDFSLRPLRAVVPLLMGVAFAVPSFAEKPVVAAPDLPGLAKERPETGRAFRQGVVTAANPYGAEAGAKILEAHGNAIDAAVAIAYALNVVEPQSAGVGGGGFMMIYLAKTDETFFIDTREKAPAGATPNMFVGVPNATLQGVAVGVPGMVRGTALALEQFGKLSLAEVLQPAIKLADEGFAATPRYAAVSCNSRSQNSPEAAAYFCPNGGNPVVGSLVQNKPLAETFRLIAKNGPDCFYRLIPEKGCDIAKGIVEGQKFNRPQAPNGKGGSMTFADLEAYQAIIRKPIEGSYRGYRIKAVAPPSSGGLTVMQMLKMLERFPLGDASQGYGFGSLRTTNVMADAMRLAFADRGIWMGDSDFVCVPGEGLLDPAYVALRGGAIVPGGRITPNPTAGDPRIYDPTCIVDGVVVAAADPVTGPGETTTHFSVVDKEGNFVTYTNTIESSHGIGVFAGYKDADGSFHNFGFLLNNELTDFNTTPSTNPFTGTAGWNDVQPNKRPRSSMTPTMIFRPDGEPLIAYGSPGGATIINSVLNVTLNLIDHKMTLQDAIDAPRMSITSAASTISMEPGFPQSTVDGLRALGYTVGITGAGGEIGSVQAVLVDPQTGKQYGAADSRREGTVIGLPRPKGPN